METFECASCLQVITARRDVFNTQLSHGLFKHFGREVSALISLHDFREAKGREKSHKYLKGVVQNSGHRA
jgi:hypothetical protein